MSLKNSRNKFLYLSLDVVLEIHHRQLEEFGGLNGVRSLDGLIGAIESPKATFDGKDLYPTVFDKATVYLMHIAQAQSFIDGNKRVALDSALTFLAINGYEVVNEEMDFYDLMIAIAEKRIEKNQIAALFEKLCVYIK